MRPLRLLAAGLAFAGPLAAQVRVEGVVRLAGSVDTVALPEARVVLHRVGIATQGPYDSTRTDSRGRFAFRFPADTTASFLLSTRFAEIEYFSAPVPAGRPGPVGPVDLIVFDTSSTVPTGTRSRTLVVSAPDAGGRRTVVDWLSVANAGFRTRVGRDSLDPTWSARLPRRVANAGLGDARFSQFSPDAVAFRNDSVFVFAPIAPGEKELLLQYELAAGVGTLDLTLTPGDSVEVFLEEGAARVRSAGWAPGDTQNFQGRSFHRWRRLGPGDRLIIRFPGVGASPGLLVGLLVTGLGVAIGVATGVAARRRRAIARPSEPLPEAQELADRIARLDAAAPPPGSDGMAAHQAERERLMAQLRQALAARPRRS